MIREIDPKFSQFHNTGDKSKAALARAISGLHEAWLSQYPDFPIPTRQTEVNAPLSPETQRLVEHMKRDGYVVYETSGMSPRALRAEGMPFGWVNSQLEDSSEAPALLAFKPTPSGLFVPGSKDIPYEEQVKLIPEQQRQVDEIYPRAGLRVRESAAWSELAWKHFKATGEKLFGEKFDFAYTWMPLYESDKLSADRAIAGGWRDDGLDVFFADRRDADLDLGLASVVEIPLK